MISILKDYYDKHGLMYKVLSFSGGKYACQSYRDGSCVFLSPNELFASPPPRKMKVRFTDVIVEEKKEDPVVNEFTEVRPSEEEISDDVISMPEYEEPVYEFEEEKQEVQKPVVVQNNKIVLQDNKEETADDFYADF